MDKKDRNEFDVTVQSLNGVIGTVVCGCAMSDEEQWTAQYLKYRRQVFINEYNKRFNS